MKFYTKLNNLANLMLNAKLFAAYIFIVTIIINYLLEPFNVEKAEHVFPYLITCLLQSLLVSILGYCYMVILNKIVDIKYYSVAKLSIFFSIYSTISGISLYLLRPFIYNQTNPLDLNYLFEELFHSFLFLIICIPIYLLLISFIKQGYINELDEDQNDVIHISSESKNSSLKLKISEFLIAECDGNYIIIYSNQNGIVTKSTIRSTMKNIEKHFLSYNNIIKVHRSFIINLNYVIDFKGSLQNSFIKIGGIDLLIPVSRDKVKHVKQKLSKSA